VGILDTFGADDRVELKVNDLIRYFRDEADTNARNEVLLNGIRARLPYSHILTMIGELDPVEREEV
jgi:hypothetical protein